MQVGGWAGCSSSCCYCYIVITYNYMLIRQLQMKFYMDTKYMTGKGDSAAAEQVQGAGDLSSPHTPSILFVSVLA